MPLADDISEAQLAFQIRDGDVGQFRVRRYRGSEGLCQLYRFEIDMVSDAQYFAIDDLIGVEAWLSVGREADERRFHGIVGRAEITGQVKHVTAYRVELVPAVWLLTHRYRSRIFQAMDGRAVIERVLTTAGIPADRYRFSLAGALVQREYCVQYRETDYNFICRLMEEEGIWWMFEQNNEGHVLVMADSTSGYRPIDGVAELPFRESAGLSGREEHVSRFRRGSAVRPGVVVLTDYNFEKPALDLESKAERGRDAGLEFSDFPGGYLDQADGLRVAGIRSEGFESRRVRGVGYTNSLRLGPGRTFSLIEHPSSGLNENYLVTSITHQGRQLTDWTSSGSDGGSSILGMQTHQTLVAARGNENPVIRQLADAVVQLASLLHAEDPTADREQLDWIHFGGGIAGDPASRAGGAGVNPLSALSVPNLLDDGPDFAGAESQLSLYECRFECIPASVVFRPPIVTQSPVVHGSQTAVVVGPSGEEIHTDKYGRVKVQFEWDREGKGDETASCWIRVVQGAAGGRYGMLFLPRVGQEVIVDFLEGDPDRPIVVGRVYNAANMPPYALPAEKTKSVIKTHSSKGGGGCNEIRFEDLKDSEQFLIFAQKDFHLRVKNEERVTVEKDRFIVVKGQERKKTISHRSMDVGAKDALHVKETRSVVVDGDVYDDYKANHDHQVASEYHLKANKVVVEADSGISFKVGGNFIVIDSAGVAIKGTMVDINGGGAAIASGVSAQVTSPAEPEEADLVQPGADTTRAARATETAAIAEKPYEGQWVSFDLVDDEGKPIAGEYYEIVTPEGKIISGTLDVNGYARRWIKTAGECQVTFPNMRSDEWFRK